MKIPPEGKTELDMPLNTGSTDASTSPGDI